jgi:diguanylate cyclase (GGDEF)-like protein/PAS domain S-box-containing protein
MKMLLRVLFLILGICLSAAAHSESAVRVGILSYRTLDITERQWQPLAAYLHQRIPEHQFQIIPLYFPDLDKAALNGQLDFILTNPEHYILLRQVTGGTAIATLMPMAEGHPVNQFGGVILVDAKRDDIKTLQDLNGKSVASPSAESFGGFIMQQWELYKLGVRPKHFLFVGMPQDKVISAVLHGDADVGYVRSGVVEAMIREGALQADAVKYIDRQTIPDFPLISSTSLYPEWPFVVAATVEPDLIKAVTLALLNLDKEQNAAISAHIFGFSPPGDYSKIEAVMLNMNVHPEKIKNINALDVYYSYRQFIWGGALLLGIIALLSIKLLRTHRRLRQAFVKYHTVADYTTDWEYWLSPEGDIIYMSPSCLAVTGYTAAQFNAQPRLLSALVHAEDRKIFDEHEHNHRHQVKTADIEFRIIAADGQERWLHHVCQPVHDRQQQYLGIRASNREITRRKHLELELRLYEAALISCADGIAIIDAEFRVQWVNRAFCELTGYSESEALERKVSELGGYDAQATAFYSKLWMRLAAGQNWRGEIVSFRKNGERYDEQLSVTPVYDVQQKISHFVLVKQDISERKRHQEHIQKLAFYDPLTQLANRRLFLNRLESAIHSCRRNRHYAALLMLDLDRFKTLNDNYGHDVGDQLLQDVARRLTSTVRQEDTVARLGGDEFVALLAEVGGDYRLALQHATQVAEKIRQALCSEYKLQIRSKGDGAEVLPYRLTVSIGATLFMDADNEDKILKQADIALYEAKNSGRNRVSLFAELA